MVVGGERVGLVCGGLLRVLGFFGTAVHPSAAVVESRWMLSGPVGEKARERERGSGWYRGVWLVAGVGLRLVL